MSEERHHYFSGSSIKELISRYESMISGSQKCYFDVDEFEEIIDHYLSAGRQNRAFNAVQQALRQHPSSTSLQLKMAVILNEKSRPLESLNILRTLEKIEVSNPEIYFTKGIALNLADRKEEAIKQFNRAIMLTDDGRAELMYNIAMVFEQKNEYHTALDFMLRAYELEPGNLSFIYDIAYCYERAGESDKAIEYYNKYLDIDPFSENVWYNLGVVFNRTEDYEQAIEAYDYAIALDDEYSSAWFNKANTLANSGSYGAAIEVYRKLLFLEEGNEQVVCYIGECYEKLEKWDKAIEYYNRTLKLNSGYADAWLGLGMVKFSVGDYPESLAHVKKALRLYPDNPEYWYAAGNIYIKLGLMQDAEKAYRKAVNIDPGDLESWFNLAETLYETKDPDGAIRTLEAASEANPGVAHINYRLAGYYLMSRNNDRAGSCLTLALSQDYEMHREFLAWYPGAARKKIVRKILKDYGRNSGIG